tara:strand:- start:71 stop:1117 length:1047 start_codon:yes stop_codon:yes gene_type:complete
MEVKFENFGIVVEVDFNFLVKVTNTSSTLYHLHFKNPTTYYSGYASHNFNPGVWLITNPLHWEYPIKHNKLLIEVTSENNLLLLLVDYEKQEIIDISNPSIMVKNYVVSHNKTSFIIAAYKASEFIIETIESLLKQETHYQKVEILIGLDACKDTLYTLLNYPLPENVKVFLFEDNVGPYSIFNTLVPKSTSKNIIFFGADDIAHEDLIETFSKNIINADLVRWTCYRFDTNASYTNPDNLNYDPIIVGGCVGMTKDIFLSLNGYQKWRASGDDEFNRRAEFHKKRVLDLEIPLFYYRQHPNSLSYHQATNQKSILRQTYRTLITDKIIKNNFPNPIRLHTEPCVKVF